MTDPKNALDPDSCEYWQASIGEFNKTMAPHQQTFQRFAKWFAGDMSDVEKDVRKLYRLQGGVTLVNMLNLVTRQTRADMFFRSPTFLVSPTEPFGPTKMTPELAHHETRLLNDWKEDANLFHEGRKCITDMLLSHIGVMKVGYSADVAVDYDLVESQRILAQTENDMIVAGRYPRVKPDDVNRVHLESHRAYLSAIERGDIPATKAVKNYLIKHIEKHEQIEQKQGGDRPTETIRNERVYARRVNPLRFYYDLWAESPSEREWVGEAFLRPMSQVNNDERYDKSARLAVQAAEVSEINDARLSSQLRDDHKPQDPMVLIYEIIDLRRKKIITYAQGASKPLRVVPYAMADILPSGPYITASFAEHPLDDIGIAPPKVYEGHQLAATLLASISTQVAKRMIPKTVFAAEAITPEEIEEIKKGLPAGLIPLRRMRQGQSINEVIQNLPLPQLPQELFHMEDRHRRAVEQYSGLGSARAGGGDFSRTATASAIISESSSSLSEDLVSVVDDFLSRIGRAVLRIMRRYYSPALVGELIGEAAIMAWPPVWTKRDILNDKNAIVVPGSTKRKNTAVDQKMLIEFYGLAQADPNIDPFVKAQLVKRICDAAGLFGLNFEGMDKNVLVQTVLQDPQLLMTILQTAMQNGLLPTPGPDKSEGGPATRPARRARDGAQESSGVQGGTANVGGGRVSTGASKGDRKREVR